MSRFDRNQLRLQVGKGGVYADVCREDGDNLPHNAMRRPKLLTNGLIVKNSRIALRNHTVPAVFFPSLDPHRQFDMTNNKVVEETVEDVQVINDTPSFIQVSKRNTPEDIFADMGLIVDDEDAVDASEDVEVEPELKDLNKPNFSDPEDVFEMLASRDIKNFEITKEDFNALKFTKGQIRKLYNNVTGKPANNTDIVVLKKDIRKVANQSMANYKRVMAEIKRIRSGD